ncbi:MAG: M20/M25/M40 family metallo-hydrolase, partial [Chloroflexota bacterium]
IGGVNQQTLLGNRVQFQDGTIGVIYSDRNTDRSKVFPLSKHYIDVGANSREDCPISVGDAAGFVRPSYAQGQRVTGKAMDDRIGCVVAIETLKGLETTPHDVFFVFSVQEEVGVRGATVAANLIKPNIGIALDVTMTGDVHKGIDMAVGLGLGPAIKAKDGGMISHVGLVQHMKSTAQSIDLPYQIEVLIGGSTDARAMQIASAGCIAGCISIPCRYVHSQSETIDMVDVEGSVALLRTILENEIPI